MRRDNQRKRKGESGQALVIIAVLLVGLIAIIALVIDGGNIYLQRRRMQNAADSGALAGVRALALDQGYAAAYAAATEYCAQRNGADRCAVSVAGVSLIVRACEDTPMTFARVLYLNQVEVCAQAAARFGPAASPWGVAPIAVREFDFDYTTIYSIWDDDKDEDPVTSHIISGSHRGWLTMNCVYPADCGAAGASELTNWMRNGYQGYTDVDDWIRGDNGTKASVIAEARVGQILILPVFDQISDLYGNKSYYHILTFAAFEVTSVQKTGTPKGISGRFIRYVVPSPPTGSEDDGVRSIVLTQ